MSYLVLARKYRPQTFDEVVQQDHITLTLTHAITAGRVVHAVLFSGPRGTGKTTVARILAKAMNCKNGPAPIPCNQCRSCKEITSGSAVDVYEIDGASNNSVDQIRELRENLKYMPAHSTYKIYIIDEVHMLSIAAFNALLKTLEEPPAHVMFIFATTEPQKIPITILSRCQRHDFRRIGIEAITKHMETVCGKEDVSIPAESLWMIAREAGGSMRDALSLLDQVLTCSDRDISYSQVLDILGIMDRKIIFEISDAIFRQDVPALLDIVDDVYDRGHDMKRLYTDLVQHVRNMLIVKIGKKVEKLVDLPSHEIELIMNQVKDVSAAFLSQIFDLLFKEEVTIKFSLQPKLAIEMVMIKIFQIKPALPIEELIEKLDMLRKKIDQTPCAGNLSNKKENEAQNPTKGFHLKPEASAAVAEPAKPFDDGSVSNEGTLKTTWRKILDIVSERSPALATNLANSVLIKLTDRSLEIEVNGNGFNINMIKRKKNMAILKGVISEFFGDEKKPIIHAHVVSNNNNQEIKEMENRLRQETLNHPLIADAIEIFNGKVVDVKIS